MSAAKFFLFSTLLAIGFGCRVVNAICPPGQIAAPASFDNIIRPALALDENPDSKIVEIQLTARQAVWDFGAGNTVPVWSYNGTVPGPTIEAEVGDTLIVRFCNDLPEETTIHWHGVETPANMDGSHISQLAVPPGSWFRYEFPLLKTGTFWYHPHIRTSAQVEKGLHGVLVVRDPAEDLALALPTREHIFVLDDILLDASGQVKEPFLGSKHEVALEQLNGREGNLPLLNGRVSPALTLEKRQPHRVRMLNAANSRFMRMSLPFHELWRIGGDQGLLTAPIQIDPAFTGPTLCPPNPSAPAATSANTVEPHISDADPTTGLMLTPGERADFVFFPQFGVFGDCMPFEWHDTQRGRHSVDFLPDGSVQLAHNVPDGSLEVLNWAFFHFTGSSTTPDYTPPATLRTLEPIDITGATPLPLTMGHTLPNWDTGESVFFIQEPGKPFQALGPEDVHGVFLGKTYVWEVKNLTGSHHNFHTHGWGFQHLETEFVDLDDPSKNRIEPATHLENKDTFLIKRRPGFVRFRSWSISRFAVTFDTTGREGKVVASGKTPTADRSGGWLLHCHILEHSALGMMSFFQIRDIFGDGFNAGNTAAWSKTLPQ